MADKDKWEIYVQLTPTHKRVGVYNTKTKEKIQLGVIDRNMELPSTLVAIAKQQVKEHNGELKEKASEATEVEKPKRAKKTQ